MCRWSTIAAHLPGRTDNEIKNYWNTHLKKRLVQMGIDPVTHKATNADELDVLDGLLPGLRPVVSSNLTHMSQWENARAEAEARLSRLSSLTSEYPKVAQSTAFMSSWKTEVAETLRPNFGVVEVEKSPVNLQTFLQEWDSSLQPHLQELSGYDSPIDVPDLRSGTSSEVMSPCDTPQPCYNYTLPSSAQITERLLASRMCNSDMFCLQQSDSQASNYNFPGESTHHHQFSPTSTLHGPDSAYNSPGVSSNTDDLFALNERASFKMFPPSVPLLWSRQQVAMADALQQPEPAYFFPEQQQQLPKPASSFNVAPPPMLNGVPNNIPIPQFEFLC